MVMHAADPNSGTTAKMQRGTLCQTRGAVTSRGTLKLFAVGPVVTCARCLAKQEAK